MGNTHVIQQGEKVLHRNSRGECRIIDGPHVLKIKSDETWEQLREFSANQHQYLGVTKRTGLVEHIPGPSSLFLNPLEISNIRVENAVELSASEVLVVYRTGSAGKKKKKDEGESEPGVERLVIAGPCEFMPTANDRIETFTWHGTDPQNKTHKIPGALKFQKLRIIPDQFYYNVTDVRTSDDALVTVKLMVFFELKKIEKMLDQTHDPIADFINSVCADVIAFASSMPYEIFIEKTALLNELDSYPQLVSRSRRIGYEVTKVVYRGYHASDKLQAMHDHAIQARTQLRLESETEEQAQKLADLKLLKEVERSQRKQEMQQAEMDHQNKLSRKEHEEKIHQRRQELEAELDAKKAENAESVAYLGSLRDLEVNLTSYMVSQHTHPDRVIQVLSDNPSNVHVHEEGQRKRN